MATLLMVVGAVAEGVAEEPPGGSVDGSLWLAVP